MKKDLLAEHATHKKNEDRMKTIERSKQWDNRPPAVKVTR